MYYDLLIKHLSEFFKDNEIKADSDGIFKGKGKKIRISYDESTKCYCLYTAEDTDEGEFKKVSAYLFDESQSEKDIESVAIDFIDTLRSDFGITKKRNATAVQLPTDAGGENISLSGLTQKLLAIFPEHKESYKNHVAAYNRFLATEFYREYIIPSVKELLQSGGKKQIKKFYDAMTDIFVHGDNEAVPFVVAIVAAALYDNDQLKAAAKDFTKEECDIFYSNIDNFSAKIKSSKKLKATLVK